MSKSPMIILPTLAIIFSVVCLVTATGKPELEIHETFKPQDCARKAKVTDVISLHYKGSLEDGTVFDSSYDRDEQFSFQLGVGQVIKGWDKGLVDVCVGEKRKLVVPPHLGYGDLQHDKIPPRSTLIFETEIFKIEDGENPVNVFKEVDEDKDDRLSRDEVAKFLKKQLSTAYEGQTGAHSDSPYADQQKMVDEIFQHEDRDDDGYITKEEFSGPKYDHDEL